MKTYQDIETELFKAQDSWRHPTPAEGGSFPHNPKPEGEVAALSVQFLLREVKAEIEHRDHATDAARIAEGELATCKIQVTARQEYIAGLQESLATSPEEPPAPTSDHEVRERVYDSALETIERWKKAEEEWEAKTGRLSGKLCDLLAEKHALAMQLVTKESDNADLRRALKAFVPRNVYDSAVEMIESKERDLSDVKEQVKVSTIAALAMFQKLKAAAVMAKSASAEQTAKYLLDAVNFHINGAMEVVNWLNGDTEEQA